MEIDDLLAAVTPRTRLVTVSQVSYATGQHLDVDALWQRLEGHADTLLCVDATQAAGRVPVRGDRADFCVASTFKWLNSIHGAAILAVGSTCAEQEVAWARRLVFRRKLLRRRSPRTVPSPQRRRVLSKRHAQLRQRLRAGGGTRVSHARARGGPTHGAEPLVATLRDGLAKLGLTVLTPPAASDRAGIVVFACPTAAEAKRHLAERGIHVHGDDGRLLRRRALVQHGGARRKLPCSLTRSAPVNRAGQKSPGDRRKISLRCGVIFGNLSVAGTLRVP